MRVFAAVIFTIARYLKQLKHPSIGELSLKFVFNVYSEVLFSNKKDKLLIEEKKTDEFYRPVKQNKLERDRERG